MAGLSARNKKSVVYPNYHIIAILFPLLCHRRHLKTEKTKMMTLLVVLVRLDPTKPNLITQIQLNDLVRDLNLNKTKPKLLSSRLQSWYLLDHLISRLRKLKKKLSEFYSMDNYLTCCSEFGGLMEAIERKHKPEEW